MIPEDVKKQVAEGGLRFEAYLPPDLAAWVVERVEQGAFTSPSEAVFVAMQTYRELDRHPAAKKELLRQMLAAGEQEAKQGKGIPHEEVIAELKREASQGRLEPAVWDRSMDRPLFED